MIAIGTQPILWHIMKWYASWGHTEFILCLGHRAEVVKDYFLKYNEALANDFVLLPTAGATSSSSLRTSPTGGSPSSTRAYSPRSAKRRPRVGPYLGDDEYFLATYGDGVTDAPLDEMIATLERSGKTGLFLSVKPRVEYHLVRSDADHIVTAIEQLAQAEVRIDGSLCSAGTYPGRDRARRLGRAAVRALDRAG